MPLKRKTFLGSSFIVLFIFSIFTLWVFLNQEANTDADKPSYEGTELVPEVSVVEIPLAGDLNSPQAEISGLAWYGDHLIILPQYPGRFPSSLGGTIFSIPKEQIIAYLSVDASEPIRPHEIPSDLAGLDETIPSYEGFEAIAFAGRRAYLTIEAEAKDGMSGYLVVGEITEDMSAFQIQGDVVQAIEPQADLSNFSEEALLITEDGLLSFYEANGANVNSQPVAHLFNMETHPMGTIGFPTLEYRLTDASSLDMDGDFWVINYLYPGDLAKVDPAEDELRLKYSVGISHTQSATVERLVEFHYASDDISRTDSPPIYLQLLADGSARNWEGLVRLDERGFLVMTDKYPETILGFVAYP